MRDTKQSEAAGRIDTASISGRLGRLRRPSVDADAIAPDVWLADDASTDSGRVAVRFNYATFVNQLDAIIDSIDSLGPKTRVDERLDEENYRGCREYVYDIPIRGEEPESAPFVLRVYSSVDVRNNTSRGKGEDAIRTVLGRYSDDETLIPVSSDTYTQRIATAYTDGSGVRDPLAWAENLRTKIEKHTSLDGLTECPECGHLILYLTDTGIKWCPSDDGCGYSEEL